MKLQGKNTPTLTGARGGGGFYSEKKKKKKHTTFYLKIKNKRNPKQTDKKNPEKNVCFIWPILNAYDLICA